MFLCIPLKLCVLTLLINSHYKCRVDCVRKYHIKEVMMKDEYQVSPFYPALKYCSERMYCTDVIAGSKLPKEITSHI